MINRAGKLVPNLSGEAMYQSYRPTPLPPNPPIALDTEMMELLVKAHKHITVLDGMAAYIPNVHQFISMYVRKEALMSSQIEGTQATLEDVLDPQIDVNANCDVADVIKYIKATQFAIARLQELPLCIRLIKETHAILMEGSRGQERSPGEFRRTQNWIGGQGSTLKNARFIPPAPEDMTEAISDLEKYINSDDDLDVLIRTALFHYQLQTIHPFLDGNGRIGRLLITVYLMQQGVMIAPVLYISYFLKKNRIEYYDRLSEVRRNGHYEQWVKFFLRAICESAEDAVIAINKISDLHEKNISIIEGTGRSSRTALRLLAYLEESPIIEIGKTSSALGTSFKALSDAVQRLCAHGILHQSSGDRRNRVFSYTAYLDLLREGT